MKKHTNGSRREYGAKERGKHDTERIVLDGNGGHLQRERENRVADEIVNLKEVSNITKRLS